MLPALRDRTSPIVVGLPDDTMAEISQRVATLGGAAHLVVMTPLDLESKNKRIRVLEVEECVSKDPAELDDATECAINEQTTLEMLVQMVEVGAVLTYYTYAHETIIRFINDSVQPAVPA